MESGTGRKMLLWWCNGDAPGSGENGEKGMHALHEYRDRASPWVPRGQGPLPPPSSRGLGLYPGADGEGEEWGVMRVSTKKERDIANIGFVPS